MYDKFFATYRKNKIDLICSYLQALNPNRQILYRNAKEAKFYSPKGINLIYTMTTLRYISFVSLLYDINLNILQKKFSNVTVLEYKEIPNYVNENFPNVKSVYVDANYDYKNKILNYDEIAEKYEIARKQIPEEKIKKLFS